MKSFDLDWIEFFNALAIYKRMSLRARHAFLENGPYSAPIRATAFAGAIGEMLSTGLFLAAPGGQTVTLHQRFRGFVKALRAMHRSRIDFEPERHSFEAYVADNFTSAERNAFDSHGSTVWRPGREGLFSKITSVHWLEGFLNGDTAQWEAQHRVLAEPRYLGEAKQPAVVKNIVRHMMARTEPEDFDELRNLCPELPLLAVSIRAGIRYALFYPMMRRDTLLPVLGLWPGVVARLHRSAATAPMPVTPQHTFSAPVFVDEMIAVLTECIAEPLRLLADTFGELYQKSAARVQSRFLAFPDWIIKYIQPKDQNRIRNAILRLQGMKMLDIAGRPSSDFRLEVTPQGRAWLGLPAKERVKSLLDRVRKRPTKSVREFEAYGDWEVLSEEVRCGSKTVDAQAAVIEAFKRIAAGKAVRLADFARYESDAHNPLKDAMKGASFQRVVRGYMYLEQPSEEQLEDTWADILARVLIEKLLPLGALEAGITDDNRVTISITDAGRYLLGLSKDFSFQSAEDAPAAIVVQPNFDIVFMAPSPLAEAELSAFTERRGKHVGAVLKITKRSIWTAASAGFAPEHVIEILRNHSSVPVPTNVEREIRGWMAQCRTVTIREAMLIHCPDAETASRVFAADRVHLAKITDTVLELSDVRLRSRLVKKLRESGIFI